MRPLMTSLAAAAGAALLMMPSIADACGGLFCQSVPVEQNAERILFEVNDDETVSVAVEIQYSGLAEDFSWILPVPDFAGELEVIPQSALPLLDNISVPRIISPPTHCSDPTGGVGLRNAAPTAEFDSAADDGGGVVVEDLPRVGPYEAQLISSGDPEALVRWLTENDYIVTPEMEPAINGYVAAGLSFLGMKLAPDAEVGDIQPVKMTYPASEPMIPLVLTAVASEPEMAVLVFVAAAERYEPNGAYGSLLVDPDQVMMDPRNNTNNYYALVSWMIDQAGGQAFVTQFADSSDMLDPWSAFLGTEDEEEARQYIVDLLGRRPYMSRMYTRMSGWEMTDDPIFTPSDRGNVDRFIDLSGRPSVDICAPVERPVPCGDTYCGPGAMCATTAEGVDGCVCPDGFVARGINRASGLGQPSIGMTTCTAGDVNPLASLGELGACDNQTCGGNGRCIEIGGFPSCDCDEGFAAITDANGDVACVAARRTFEPEQILSPPGGCATSGCSSSGGEMPGSLLWAGLLGMMGLAARRRR